MLFCVSVYSCSNCVSNRISLMDPPGIDTELLMSQEVRYNYVLSEMSDICPIRQV